MIFMVNYLICHKAVWDYAKAYICTKAFNLYKTFVIRTGAIAFRYTVKYFDGDMTDIRYKNTMALVVKQFLLLTLY